MKNLLNKTFIILVGILILCACRKENNPESRLDGSNCNLPCWNSIVPGETTKDQYVQWIQSYAKGKVQSSVNIIDNDYFQIFNSQISYVNSAGNFWISAYVTPDTIVNYVQICGNDTLNTTIGMLIDETGEPETVISEGGYTGGKIIILINSRKGVSYWYLTQQQPKSLQNELRPNIEIHCLDIFNPAKYYDMLNTGVFSGGMLNAEETLNIMLPWNGYGELDVKYP